MQLVPYCFGTPRVVVVLTLATSDAVVDEGRPIQVNRFGWAIRLGWRFQLRWQCQTTDRQSPILIGWIGNSVAILFIALSVVNGFDRAEEDILSRVPHAVVTSVTEPLVDLSTNLAI